MKKIKDRMEWNGMDFFFLLQVLVHVAQKCF